MQGGIGVVLDMFGDHTEVYRCRDNGRVCGVEDVIHGPEEFTGSTVLRERCENFPQVTPLNVRKRSIGMWSC